MKIVENFVVQMIWLPAYSAEFFLRKMRVEFYREVDRHLSYLMNIPGKLCCEYVNTSVWTRLLVKFN